MAEIKVLKKSAKGYIIENATTDQLTLAGFTVIDGAVIDSNGVAVRTGKQLLLYETDNGNYVGFVAPSLAANIVWTLPNADGTPGQVLQTDGSANLSWGTGGGGLPVVSDTVTAGSTKNIETIVATTKKVLKWIVYLYTNTKEQTLEVMALNTISDVSYSMSNILGDSISAVIDVKIDTGNVVFEVTNNESVLLNISLLRLSI